MGDDEGDDEGDDFDDDDFEYSEPESGWKGQGGGGGSSAGKKSLF
jgi:hypothetical protein